MQPTNNIYHVNTNQVEELTPREQFLSNALGVISAAASGPIAAFGAAFLTVVLVSGIGTLPLIGVSLLVGTGAAVAAFFISRKAISTLIKNGKNQSQITPQAPGNPIALPTPALRLVSQASIETYKQRLQACLNNISTMTNQFEQTLATLGISEGVHHIPGQTLQFIRFNTNQLAQNLNYTLNSSGLTVDGYRAYLQQCSKNYIDLIEAQIRNFEAAAANSKVPKPSSDSLAAIKGYLNQTHQQHADQNAITLLTTYRLAVSNLFGQISVF